MPELTIDKTVSEELTSEEGCMRIFKLDAQVFSCVTLALVDAFGNEAYLRQQETNGYHLQLSDGEDSNSSRRYHRVTTKVVEKIDNTLFFG